jgi:DNA polymerase-3 subunit gamma/tau
LKINYLPSVYQPTASQPAVEGGAGKKSESKPIVAAAVSAAPVAPAEPAIQAVSSEAAPVATIPVEATPVQEIPGQEAAVQSAPIQVVSAETSRPTSHGLRSAKKVVSTGQAEHAAEVSAQGNVQNEPFTFEEVNFVWTQIAQGFKKGNFINKYVMMNREISLIDSNIHIKVEGEVQMQQFNDSLKLELVGTLREKLKNDTIDISLDLMAGEVSDKKMIYTQSDKYDFLSQKHPILVEMKQRMGLDHEF